MLDTRKGSLAIIGSRGIPANYGGFETLAEQIGPRLVQAGWEVSVSCESANRPSKPRTYLGVRLFYFPVSSFLRVVGEPLYDICSLIRSSLTCDCVYMLGYGAGFFFFIPRIFGKSLVVNPDGFEWKRLKFNKLERRLLLACEQAAARFATTIVVDSLAVKDYYKSRYGLTSVYIAYGVNVPQVETWDGRKLNEMKLPQGRIEIQPGGYWLTVARLEPENNLHVIVKSFLMSRSDRKLVIVGDSSNTGYKKRLSELIEGNGGSEKVIMVGAVYDWSLLNMFRQNCFAYIHGHSVGGTNPALLEAMSMNNIIIVHENPFNKEVSENSVLYFREPADLAAKMREVEHDPGSYEYLKGAALSRVVKKYTWGAVTEQYSTLFGDIINRKKRTDHASGHHEGA